MSLICGASKKVRLKNDAGLELDSTGFLSNVSKDYELFIEIGRACNGMAPIYLAYNKASGRQVAIRIVPLDNSQIELNLLMREVVISRMLQQPNLLPLQAAFTHSKSLWIAMPLMGYGSCQDLIHAHFHTGIPEPVIAVIVRQVLQALVYLHDARIVHRSVRPSHFLISSSGHVCLTGMRNAYRMEANVTFDYPLHSPKSLNYYSPELLRQNLGGYGMKSDIYSLGVTVCELANGSAPFHHMTAPEMFFAKLSGVIPRLLDKSTMTDCDSEKSSIQGQGQVERQFSAEFHDFAELCCQPDPAFRPTARELLSHSFVKANDTLQPEAIPKMLLPVTPLTRTPSVMPQIDVGAINETVQRMSSSSIADCQWDFCGL